MSSPPRLRCSRRQASYPNRDKGHSMNILIVDVGGTHVKILASGEKVKREFDSGPTLTAREMVSRVKKLADGWEYELVSIGYPGPVVHDRPMAEPHNLGKGWMGFNFAAAFKPEDVVLGGGNANNLKKLPPLCRRGDNANAFKGGFRMWEGPLEGTITRSRKQTAQAAM